MAEDMPTGDRRSAGTGDTAHAWRYLRIQLMTFVSAIVGPVLSSSILRPNRIRRWDGLFITAADVLIAPTITNGARSDGISEWEE